MANECIPLYVDADEVTGITTAAVVGKTFLGVSAAANVTYPGVNIGVATVSAGVKPFGVAAYDQPQVGGFVGVLRDGIYPVTCGAAVTAGQEVEADANGHAIPSASGKPAGRAVTTTTAAGTDVYVALYK